MHAIRILAVALTLCCWNNVFSEPLPPRVQINYTLSNGTITLPVSEILEINGNAYTITSEAHATGILALVSKGGYKRKSRGLIIGQGLRPDEFRLQSGKSTRTAVFDWNKKILTLEYDDKKDSVSLPENAHDRLSFPYTFAFSQPSENEVRVAMTDGKKLSQYRYLISGKTTLSTAMGDLKTLHLVRQHDKSGPATEIWLAVDHHLLPVRILVTEEDGDKLDQVVTQIAYQ